MIGFTSAQSSSASVGDGTALTTSLRWWYDSGAGPVEVSPQTLGIHDGKITVDYEHPATLSFSMFQDQQSMPIPLNSIVIFSDPNYGTGTPLFEGWVHEIQPSSNHVVSYTAYDPTKRAGDEIYIHDAPPFATARSPRCVFNCKSDQDQDYAESRTTDATTQEIIETLLADAYTSLLALYGAPPVTVGGPAYESADLSALTYVPQDKVVFEAETLRTGLDRILDLYPAYRWVFWMGEAHRKWRLVNVRNATAVTMTLNDFSGPYKVLNLSIERSIEGRKTAVKIFGPKGTTNATVTQSSGLTKQWTDVEGTFLETSGPTAVSSYVGAKWQITDPTKRHVARLLPSEVAVPTGGLQASQSGGATVNLSFVYTRRPHLVATWDAGTTWEPVKGWRFTDSYNGVIQAAYPVVKKVGSAWVLPDDVRLYFAYYGEPITVRYPTSGYSGTAYDDFGIETQQEIYDEMLAIGWEYGTPVTSAARQAEYVKLAQAIQESKRDTVYRGTLTLLGLMYEFLHLDRKVNLAAVDVNGDPVVTGWETAGMIVTHVELDFARQMTTLGFSTDLADYALQDIDSLKALAKIKAYQTQAITSQSISAVFNRLTKSNLIRIDTSTVFIHTPENDTPEQTVF